MQATQSHQPCPKRALWPGSSSGPREPRSCSLNSSGSPQPAALRHAGGVARLDTPRLLKLDEPCSLMADFYNTLTTNPSHNPLNEILLRWLTMRFPALEWRGWPNQRGTGPSVSDDGGRRQWTFVSRTDALVICAEAKSVTANNWGNKSKEIFDRVAELRTACASAGIECLTLLMFDGDLSQDNLRELAAFSRSRLGI